MEEKGKLMIAQFKGKKVKVLYRDCKGQMRKAFGFLKDVDNGFLVLENERLGDVAISCSEINTIFEDRRYENGNS
ncbi:MAG: hypothetical protein ABIH59_00910 [archaeon]